MLQSTPLWWSKAPALLRHSVAVLSVAAALVAGLLFNTFLHSGPFVSLFLCAIMFAAWFGGVGPGLLATALSILAFDYYFVPPIDSFAIALRMPFRGVFRCGKNITLPAARLVVGRRDRANTTPWSV